jgi:hypothetical protein
MTQEDLNEFSRMFGIQIDREVQMLKSSKSMLDEQFSNTATAQIYNEFGYQFTISERQLDRMISMLKQKGYYHDEDYTKRLREEELILSHPELKRMHDEYKMMLYFLCGDEYQ